jgi:hypothetical protein
MRKYERAWTSPRVPGRPQPATPGLRQMIPEGYGGFADMTRAAVVRPTTVNRSPGSVVVGADRDRITVHQNEIHCHALHDQQTQRRAHRHSNCDVDRP